MNETVDAYRMALAQIEHDGEVINRLKQALRVATHSPHNQDGEPNEGFPVCSVCGAIQTERPTETVDAARRQVQRYAGRGYTTAVTTALDAFEDAIRAEERAAALERIGEALEAAHERHRSRTSRSDHTTVLGSEQGLYNDLLAAIDALRKGK